MLLALFSPQIQEFYTYSVPIKKGVIVPSFPTSPDEFVNIQTQIDSTCFTTPQNNIYCYKKPKSLDDKTTDHLISSIVGNNGVNGELHFDKVGLEGGFFTIKNVAFVNQDSALFTFADKDYRIGNKDRTTYEIQQKFEYGTHVKKYDSFITHCTNFTGKSAIINQFLGITTIDEIDYFLIWHTVIEFEKPILCHYPEITQHSLLYNYDEM